MCVHDFLRPGFAAVPRLFASLLLVSCSLGGGHALAQSSASPGAPSDVLEQRRQLERIDLLRRQQERGHDVRRLEQAPEEMAALPLDEQPCVLVEHIRLNGDENSQFSWLLEAAAGPDGRDAPQGRCLGSRGVNLVLRRLQNALIAEGYITSRVVAEAQDLRAGTLALRLNPGRIHAIRLAEESLASTSLRTAVPARPGDVLNLRDIEQALENLKRVSGADADIRIEPAETPGESDLVIVYRSARPLRLALAADDGGMRSTGKRQGNLTVSWDNPAGLNDLAYLSIGHDLGGRSGVGSRGTESALAHYSLPFGYWSAAATVSHNRDHQTVSGLHENYLYRGQHDTAEIKLSRLIHRNASQKTLISIAAFRRASRNFIDDTEVEVQRRTVGGWQFSANHRRFFGRATLDASISHKRGTGAFGAIAAPEEAFGEGTARMRLSTAEVSLEIPFDLAGRTLQYRGAWRGQWNHTRLTPQDMFAIGGRYTVRGFDGEMVLSAERGWLLRNELGLPLGIAGIEGYAGIDYGVVAGPTSELLLGRHLAGAIVGLRGSAYGVAYDAFLGVPLHKPDGFRTATVAAGFRINYSF